jgi:N-acetyl-anhydromuramoyl-L-alanine amidase
MWRINQQGWLSAARASPSPNFDARPVGTAIDLLVVHYISLPPACFSGEAIEDFFLNRLDHQAHAYFAPLKGVRVSAHFLIRRNGELVQFVSTLARAWHAGVSKFVNEQGEARERCNDFSIGVELEGDEDHAFTSRQYRQLASLTRALSRHHELRYLAGHSDIAPGRKSDPGPHFDWVRFIRSVEKTGLQRHEF